MPSAVRPRDRSRPAGRRSKTSPPLSDPTRVDLLRLLEASGYTGIRTVGGRICAIRSFLFTTALLVGLDEEGYELRYCYEHAQDALAGLAAWEGHGHPPGPWIKCKGSGLDLLNPAFCQRDDVRSPV